MRHQGAEHGLSAPAVGAHVGLVAMVPVPCWYLISFAALACGALCRAFNQTAELTKHIARGQCVRRVWLSVVSGRFYCADGTGARTSSASGEVVLKCCFGQDEPLARWTDRSLVVAFSSITVSFTTLPVGGGMSLRSCVRSSLMRRGGSAVGPGVGALHFFNMAMFHRYGRAISSIAAPSSTMQRR